jgi:hypothetical protein
MAINPDRGTDRRYAGFTRREWQRSLHFLLHGCGFVGSTLLITWGLFFLFFLAIGGFSFDGFVHQLNNFTSRYVAAEPARTGAFLDMFAVAHMILSTAVIALRANRILPPRQVEGDTRHG